MSVMIPGGRQVSPNRLPLPGAAPGGQPVVATRGWRRAASLLLGVPGTWRWQTALFVWILALLAAIALVIATLVTNSTSQTFSRIAAVAVPSINTTNQATTLLSSQVADTAEYILSSQSEANFLTSDRYKTLRQSLNAAQANYDQQLQNGYAALVTYRNDSQPSVDAALKSLSYNTGALQESLAQARGLADSKQFDAATATYLAGQNNYYARALADLYYLRSIHVTRLEQAEQDATGGAALWQWVAIAAAIIFTLALLLVNLWLVVRVKRVLQPFLNLALIVLVVYSIVLAVSFTNTRSNLGQMVDSYKTTTLLSDARLNLTDAAADQIKWVIGGTGAKTAAFVGDPVYEQDFKTKTARLLSAQKGSDDPTADPALVVSCLDNQPNGYTSKGLLADICPTISNDSQQISLQSQFVQTYKNWLTADATFRQAVNSNDLARGLSVRTAGGFSTLLARLDALTQRNIDQYNSRNAASVNSLNLLGILNWVIFPVAFLLAGTGLLLWRRQF